jgi:peptide deformylase
MKRRLNLLAMHYYGDSILRTTAAPVSDIDDDLKALAAEMIVTMRHENGVGLAATQIGRTQKIAIIDPTGGEADPYILINPEIVFASPETLVEDEGCLSVPTIWQPVKRHKYVSVKALDLDGKEYTIENADGRLARAIQHEVDHLNGILFIDRLSPMQRRLINGKLKKLAKSGGDEK